MPRPLSTTAPPSRSGRAPPTIVVPVTDLFTTADPLPWLRLARVLDEQATVLRVQGSRVAAAAAQAHWHSPAGRAFAARAASAATGARGAAAGLDDAAEVARHHAAVLAAVAAALGRT